MGDQSPANALVQAILALAKVDGKDASAAVKQAELAMLGMKRKWRKMADDLDQSRKLTATAREVVDQAHLHLANYLYEQRHYENEIRSCQDFQHSHTEEQIGLVSLEEFWAGAPEEIKSKLNQDEPDQHQLMIQRLEYEKLSRAQLVEQLKEVKAERDKKVAAVEDRRKLLDVGTHLTAMSDAMQKMQHQLGMTEAKEIALSKLAELLPAPLYVVYTQLAACRDAHSEDIEVGIEGDRAQAQEMARKAVEAGLSTKKARTEGSTVEELLKQHPLWVTLDIKEKSTLVTRVLFYYLPALHLVSAKTTQEHQVKFLSELFEGDDGEGIPREAARHLQDGNFEGFPQDRKDRPYGWAQKLAGMELLPSQPYCPGEPQVYGRGPFEEGLSTFRQGSFALRVLGLLRMKIVVAKYLVAQINPMKADVSVKKEALAKASRALKEAGGICAEAASRSAELAAAIKTVTETAVNKAGGRAEGRVTTKESDEAEGATASRRDEESDEEADGAGLPKSGVFARPRMLKAEIQGPGEATVSVEIAIPGQYPWEAPSVSVAACSGVGEDVTEALRKQVPAAVAEAQRSLAATLKVSGGDGIGDRASTAKAIADVLGRPPGFGPDPSWAFAEVAVTASIAVAALAGLKCMEETAGGG